MFLNGDMCVIHVLLVFGGICLYRKFSATGFCRLLDQKFVASACAQCIICTIGIQNLLETRYGHALTGNCLVKQPAKPCIMKCLSNV